MARGSCSRRTRRACTGRSAGPRSCSRSTPTGTCPSSSPTPPTPRRTGRRLRGGDRDRTQARARRRRADGLLGHGRALSQHGALPGGGHLTSLETKLARLRTLLAELPSALVAFSGGVDSTFLLRLAHEVLGSRCAALTTVSPATPAEDVETAKSMAAALGAAHLVVDVDELAIDAYAANPTNRCFFCKDNLFTVAAAEAGRRGLAAVLDGANVDDLADHRPGLLAAAEHGVRHPLA